MAIHSSVRPLRSLPCQLSFPSAVSVSIERRKFGNVSLLCSLAPYKLAVRPLFASSSFPLLSLLRCSQPNVGGRLAGASAARGGGYVQMGQGGGQPRQEGGTSKIAREGSGPHREEGSNIWRVLNCVAMSLLNAIFRENKPGGAGLINKRQIFAVLPGRP